MRRISTILAIGLIAILAASSAYALGIGRLGSSFGRLGSIGKKGTIVAQPTGKILLADGVSHLLLADGVSRLCRAGGC